MSDVPSVIFSRDDIRRRVRELGGAITADYAGRDLVLVCVLKGAAVFLADLLREIRLPATVEFMAISRYGDAAESLGRVRILMDLQNDVAGRDVVVVEDIVDTGLTLSYLLATLRGRGAASVEVCALLDRTVRRIAPLVVRYAGFDCPDRFVLGYGLDHDERYRNLSHIVAVDDVGALGDGRSFTASTA